MLGYRTKLRLRKCKVLLKQLIRYPTTIANAINWNIYWMDYVRKKYPKYYEGAQPIDPSSIVLIDETQHPRTYNEGSSLENAIFKAIVSKYEDCRFLEIGTLHGHTVANVADVAKECVTIDIKESSYIIGKLIRDKKNVQMITADTFELDFEELGKFDVIFVDGGKTYDLVKNDVSKGLRQLNSGGTMIVHDYVLYSDYFDDRDAGKYFFESDKVRFMGIRWEVFAAVLDVVTKVANSKNLYYVASTRSLIITDEEYPKWDGLDGIYEVYIKYTGERV